MSRPVSICRKLLTQSVRFALAFALLNTGNIIAARIAMMAITTSNSTKEKALFVFIVCLA
jgi:hypothetical protein